MWGLFYIILSVPQNNVMDLNNVMVNGLVWKHIFFWKNEVPMVFNTSNFILEISMKFASGMLLTPQAQRCVVCVASYLVYDLWFREHNTILKYLRYLGIKVGENIIGTCSLH
jgi:hypothetical protein